MSEIPVESKNYAHTHSIVLIYVYIYVCVHTVCIIFFIPFNTGNTTTLNTILQPCSVTNYMSQESGFSSSVLE